MEGMNETSINKSIEKSVLVDPIGRILEQVLGDLADTSLENTDFDFSFLSAEQKAESMWAIAQEIKRQWVQKRGEKIREEENDSDKKENAVKLQMLQSLYADEETKKAYLGGIKRHREEDESINGDYEIYQDLVRKIKTAESAYDSSARNIFSKRGKNIKESDRLLFMMNHRALESVRQELAGVLKENPQLSALAEYDSLKTLSKEIRETGFGWVNSKRAQFEQIEAAAISGRPVLLLGPSGTGKTTLTREASIKLSGIVNNETPGKDARFEALIARRAFAKREGEEVTYFEYGEIGEAVTGKTSTLDDKPIHQGRIVLDDEFNLLPPTEQTERLARIASWTPGKKVRMPVTNKEETVAPNFLYMAAANLASSKYVDRAKIPPEVLRKFSKVDVGYMLQTADSPEIYESMLSALMDENGRLWASKDEISPLYEYKENKRKVQKNGVKIRQDVKERELVAKVSENGREQQAGGFLWRFANAINEINKSFSDEETVKAELGEGQFLKDLIIDIGVVSGWLAEYKTYGHTVSLEDFIIQRLNGEFLEKSAYSEDDRNLAREFFRYFGIETDPAKIKKVPKPKVEIMTPVEMGLLSPRVKYLEVVREEATPTSGRFITEDGKSIEYTIGNLEIGGKLYEPGKIYKKGDKFFTFKGHYLIDENKTQGYFELYEPIVSPPRDPEVRNEGLSLELARNIMERTEKGRFFGPEEVETTFGQKIENIPPITFTEKELELARDNNQFLILRLNVLPDGIPLTMEQMNTLLQNKLKAGPRHKILYNVDWYKDEAFYKQDTPKLSWALASKETIPDSKSKNYLEQTELLLDYAKTIVEDNTSFQQVLLEAETEFNQLKSQITDLLDHDVQKAGDLLLSLKITHLLRHTPAEVTYDLLVRLQNNIHDIMTKGEYVWTNGRSSVGNFVDVGNADAGGAGVRRWKPGNRLSNLGASLSRSA